MNTKNIFLSLATALGSAAVAYRFLSPMIAAVIIPVLIIHEVGHIMAGILVGADVSAPIFIPLGIFVLGMTRIRNVSEEFKGLVAIAGPALGYGLALGLLLSAVYSGLHTLTWVCVSAILVELWSATCGSDGRKYRRARRRYSGITSPHRRNSRSSGHASTAS